ncbi:MAG: hypothetical protein KAU90_05670, partial [Sulfurovaceae bacterium]|nr:hypothetical protein [Sulfurovaceae bacterium]
MEKLELYLIAVSLFGLFIGWFILKEFFRKRDIHSLNGTIKEKEICLKNLEIDCSQKQNKLDRLIDESIVCKHELLQKSNLLRKKSDELYKIQKELDSIRDKILKVKTVENQNRELIYKVSQLEKLQIKPRVGENKSNDVQELQRLRSIIIEKDKLIENRKKDNISYIEISKDQFEQI